MIDSNSNFAFKFYFYDDGFKIIILSVKQKHFVII